MSDMLREIEAIFTADTDLKLAGERLSTDIGGIMTFLVDHEEEFNRYLSVATGLLTYKMLLAMYDLIMSGAADITGREFVSLAMSLIGVLRDTKVQIANGDIVNNDNDKVIMMGWNGQPISNGNGNGVH